MRATSGKRNSLHVVVLESLFLGTRQSCITSKTTCLRDCPLKISPFSSQHSKRSPFQEERFFSSRTRRSIGSTSQSGMISLLVVTSDGSVIETGVIGREG